MPRPKTPRATRSLEYKSTQADLKARRKYLNGKKQLNLALPEGLVDKAKSAAAISGLTIKDYIEEAIIAKLKSDGLYTEE